MYFRVLKVVLEGRLALKGASLKWTGDILREESDGSFEFATTGGQVEGRRESA